MDRVHTTQRHNGNWIINLSVLLCNLNIIISRPCNSNNATSTDLPDNWPCEWSSGEIPYVFNFYSIGARRLINMVNKGHDYLERRSCLRFIEHNPIEAAKRKNFTYLYYNFSGVLENCCLNFFHKPIGRRLVLITPVCSLPAEIAHATLHGMGLKHKLYEPFSGTIVRAALFPTICPNASEKMMLFDES